MSTHSLTTDAIKVLKMPLPGNCLTAVQTVSNGTTTPTKYIGGSQDSSTERKPSGGGKSRPNPQAIACDKFIATLTEATLLSDGENPPDILNLGDNIVVSYGLEGKDGRRTGRTRTKFYREAYTVRIDGEAVAKLLQRSNDGCGYSELTLYNHVFYRGGWTGYITRILRKLEAVIHIYTGIDVAIDAYRLRNKVHRLWLEVDVKNYGRSKLAAYFDSTGKVLTGLDIGAKSADNRMTIYNKSPEFDIKPYQKEHCKRFGLDTDRLDIDRAEVKMRADVLKRFLPFPTNKARREHLDAKEYQLNSGAAIKEFSKSIKERRQKDIAQAREDARAAIEQLGDYYGAEANNVRRERDTVLSAIRAKYREERLSLNAAKADSEAGPIEYVESVDNSIDELLNGNFDYRQLENPAVLADMHKRSAKSLIKMRKGTNKRADRNEVIHLIDYDAFGAVDIQLATHTKQPKPVWGVQRKISFDVRESYTDLDLMNGTKEFSRVIADCHKVARRYGITDWYLKQIPKWREDKKYHDAIRKAVQSAPMRWNTASLGYWMPPATTDTNHTPYNQLKTA